MVKSYTVHQSTVDKNNNFRDRPRDKDGYVLGKWDDTIPFRALVTAWFPASQTINVTVPTNVGQREFESVIVYGGFMEAVGTVKTPKIATGKGTDTENTWQTYRNDKQLNPSNSEYVLDNHIEALVTKTNVGYAATAFRFVTPDSPLLANAKYGRTLTRYDDGSYRIHDDDGNMQFKHPSGLSTKIGKNGDDISLDAPLPDHEKNVQDYDGKVVIKHIIPSSEGDYIFEFDGNGLAKIEHPSGSIIDYDSGGLFGVTSGTGENLKKALDDIIDSVLQIVTNGGTNPDYTKLNQVKADLIKLLK